MRAELVFKTVLILGSLLISTLGAVLLLWLLGLVKR